MPYKSKIGAKTTCVMNCKLFVAAPADERATPKAYAPSMQGKRCAFSTTVLSADISKHSYILAQLANLAVDDLVILMVLTQLSMARDLKHWGSKPSSLLMLK